MLVGRPAGELADNGGTEAPAGAPALIICCSQEAAACCAVDGGLLPVGNAGLSEDCTIVAGTVDGASPAELAATGCNVPNDCA